LTIIYAEKRVVQFGDGDVKVAYCELGIAFGDANTPDGNSIESDYAFGMQLSYRDVIAMNDLLDKVAAGESKEFTYLDTTLKVGSESDVEAIKDLLVSWSELAIMEARSLEKYLVNKSVEHTVIPSVSMIQLEDGNFVPKDCCTFTNPITSGGKSYIDDINLPCGADCSGECEKCIIQHIMNEAERDFIRECIEMDSMDFCDCCGANLVVHPWARYIGLCPRCAKQLEDTYGNHRINLPWYYLPDREQRSRRLF